MAIGALLGFTFLMQAAAPARAGVVAIGTDPAAAGELQRALEAKLVEVPRVAVVGATTLAERLAPPAPAATPAPAASPAESPSPDASPAPSPAATPTVSEESLAEAKKLLEEAVALYYEDSAAQALDRLGALAALQSRTPGFPLAEKIRLRLWRMAVFLALGDKTGADGEAVAALKLDPRLVVDLSELPPSAKEALDAARASYRVVTVIVNGIPPNATVTIDDRPASARDAVITGTRHRIVVSAPGRRDVSGSFEAKSDIALRMSLPLALEESAVKRLEELVTRGARAPEDEALLADLASKLQCDWLVFAHAKTGAGGEARGLLVNLPPNGVVVASPPVPWAMDAGTKLATWAKDTLAQALPSGIVVAPSPAPTPTSVRASQSGLTAGAGLVVSQRTREVKGSAGGGYATPFVGAGPEAFASYAAGAWSFAASASYTSYSLSYVDVKMPDGTSQKVGGGDTIAASLGAWRVFGADESRTSFRAGLALAYETHTAVDVKAQGNIGLLPSHTRLAPALDAGVRVPFRMEGGRVLGVEAGASLAPIALFQESPSGAMGNSPLGGPDAAWRAGLAIKGARFDGFVGYAGEMRSVAFKGRGDAPTQPDLVDAKVTETHHGMRITLATSF